MKGVEVGANRRRLLCEWSLVALVGSIDMLPLVNILGVVCLDEPVLVGGLETNEATMV